MIEFTSVLKPIRNGLIRVIPVALIMIAATIYTAITDERAISLARADKSQYPAQEELDAIDRRPIEEKIYTVGCVPNSNDVTILNSVDERDVNSELSSDVSDNWRNWDIVLDAFFYSGKRQIASGRLATPGSNKHFSGETHYVFTSEWMCTMSHY